MRFGLSDETLETLNGFFRSRENIQKAVLYGSRAMGNYRAGSDIDITLITGKGFSTGDLLDLEGELAGSSLPYFVDLSIFSKLTNKNFIEHINRAGKILYERSPALEQKVQAMPLSREEKLKMMASLNWDYRVSPEDMLAVAEGKKDKVGPFDREFLFVRFLERAPWHRLIAFWGVEAVKELYTPELARRLFPRDLRNKYDFALAVLRREPVSAPGWGSERYQSKRYRFFSHRGYGA